MGCRRRLWVPITITALASFLTSVVPAHATGWWPGFAGSGPGDVFALARVNGQLYAGGYFTMPTPEGDARNIARWDGAAWHPVGGGLDEQVDCLETYGGVLYAGGFFDVGTGSRGIARWDGTAWRQLGHGADGWVHALCEYEGSLYVGGDFKFVGDSVSASYVARWNGTSWSALGVGVDWPVWALAVYRDELWLGGTFQHAGGLVAPGLARWGAWFGWATAPGTAFDGAVLALTVFEGDLVAGGNFGRAASGVWSPNVARFDYDTWNWSSFYPSGGGPGPMRALTPFGTGLAGGGAFGAETGATQENIALAQPGATPTYSSPWLALGSGTNGAVRALVADGVSIYAGGAFTTAGGLPAAGIARWDGSIPVAAPTPVTPALTLEAWPSPFVNGVRIRFALPPGSRDVAEVTVRDLQGRAIASVYRGPAGDARELRWDGRDDAGRGTPAGVYWIVARAGDIVRSCRTLRMR